MDKSFDKHFAKDYTLFMNKKVARIRIIAKQTLKILDLFEAGRTSQEIMRTLGVDRSLVDYYKKIVSEKDEIPN